MKLHSSFRRIVRPSGGLFLGIRYSFPTSLYDTTPFTHIKYWTKRELSIGLIFWLWNIILVTNFSEITNSK